MTAACATGPDSTDAPDKETLASELLDGKADTGLDWCDQWGWYNDGECDQFCLSPDPDCNADPLGPAPAGAATRYPIILVHGFAASASSPVGSFWKVADALRADGHVVVEADLPPLDAPAGRAPVLAQQIDALLAQTGAAKVNIIAHSQGGLDARYLIARLGYGDRVATLTTISTPHRGSAFADVALGFTSGDGDRMLTALVHLFDPGAPAVNINAGLAALTERDAPAFNAATPDDPRVYYQSWAGVASPTGVASAVDLSACDGKLLLHPGTMDRLQLLLPAFVWRIVGHGGVDTNDGLVTVASAKWGEFRGCIPADHASELGQLQRTFDPATGFDHVRFYRNLAFELAARGD